MRISELSKQTGVHKETVRYYERIGVLPKPERKNNGYRIYAEHDIERLQFIQRARTLDFSLTEITEILDFREREIAPCNYVMDVMAERITEIEGRIHDLEQMRAELMNLHKAGQALPEDAQMRECVCHLIRTGIDEQKET